MTDINTEMILQAEFRNRAGDLADPDTVKGWIKPPGDPTSTPLVFTRAATGIWEAVWVATEPGEHEWRVEGSGSVKRAGERHFSVKQRKVLVPTSLSLLPQIPIISRGVPAYDSTNSGGANAPLSAVDSAYGSFWRSVVSPNSGTPVWLALDMRSVKVASKKTCWIVVKGRQSTYWGGQPSDPLGSDPNTSMVSMPRNYLVQGHISSAGLPGANDPGWHTVVTVVDNRFHTNVHQNLDLSTYNWLRFYFTGANGATGVNDDIQVEVDVRDVSGGTQDSFCIYGDSVSVEAFGGQRPDNATWVNIGPIEDAIEGQTGRWAPVIVNASTIGWKMSDADLHKVDYLANLPCKYVFINQGQNDENAANIDLTTVGGVNSTYAKQFKTSLQNLISYFDSLGKISVVPRIMYGNLNPWSVANTNLLNTIIDQVVANNVGRCMAGPDLYALFFNNQNLLRDSLHPTYDNTNPGGETPDTFTGYENYIRLWVNWMIQHLYS